MLTNKLKNYLKRGISKRRNIGMRNNDTYSHNTDSWTIRHVEKLFKT